MEIFNEAINAESLIAPEHPSAAIASKSVILLFDLISDGHHPGFLRHLAQYWLQTQLPGQLHIVVAPEFLTQEADWVESFSRSESIRFTAVTQDEIAYVRSQSSLIRYAWALWKVFCQYATQLQATHAVLMYFDIFQVPLALGCKAPCSFSGIYFRPTFHYAQFANHRSTWRDRIRAWRQKLLLAQVLKHPQLKTLFSMDWFAVPAIEPFKRQVNILPLADPVTLHSPDSAAIEQARVDLKIEPARRVFLLFGKIGHRKGILQTLDALHHLNPTAAKQVCLLVVGCLDPDVVPEVQARIAALSDHPAQVIVCDRYFKSQELQAYLGLADVVLAPYQSHVGTCATMLHAATAQKPVIVSDYGLMGELARFYELGSIVDSSNVKEIAQAMINYLEKQNFSSNPEKMRNFVLQNLWHTYAETVFKGILE